MKKWPENGDPVKFDEITEPLKKVVGFGYRLRRKNRSKNPPTEEVLELGKKEKAIIFEPDERFSSEYFRRWRENFDSRRLIDEILDVAVQLGIEQGRRLERESLSSKYEREKLGWK